MTDLYDSIAEAFSLEKSDPKTVSALQLAFIGDAVFEMFSRTIAVSSGNHKITKLHGDAISRENARVQSKMALFLEESLTEEERSVYRRGRNADVVTKAKNATVQEYHRATGLEAVIGYLYLSGKPERIAELLQKGWASENVLNG